jgi:hypothetical protein
MKRSATNAAVSAAIFLTCTLPAVAETAEAGGLNEKMRILNVEERKRADEIQGRLNQYLATEPKPRDPNMAGLLNTIVPGLGAFYASKQGGDLFYCCRSSICA